jgi:hypothetical protein
MAKIHEETIVIKFSKIIKDNENVGPGTIGTEEVVTALTAVSEELVGPGVVVEVELLK